MECNNSNPDIIDKQKAIDSLGHKYMRQNNIINERYQMHEKAGVNNEEDVLSGVCNS